MSDKNMSDKKTEATMRYRPDKFQGATPSQKKPIYYYKVFEGEEVEKSLKDGWFISPEECFKKKKK